MKFAGSLVVLLLGCALIFVGSVEYDLSAQDLAAVESRQAEKGDETAVRRQARMSRELGWFKAGAVAADVAGALLIVWMGWLMTRRRSATRAAGRGAVTVSVLTLGFTLFLLQNYRANRERINGRDAAAIRESEKRLAEEKAARDVVLGDWAVSRFLDVDVGAVQTNLCRKIVLPLPLGPFSEGHLLSNDDGKVREAQFVFECAAFEDMDNAVRRVEGLMPELMRRLECRCADTGTDKDGQRWWGFILTKTLKWMAQIYIVREKEGGVPVGNLRIAFCIRRENLDPDMPGPKRYPDSERVAVPKEPPKGDLGEGQDETWVRATFPKDADMILAKGYEKWLSEWVGVMANNGHYKAIVRVAAITNGTCELVCGPYRVHLTKPGDYGFALEYLEKYRMYTEPKTELKVFMDRGHRGPGWKLEDITSECLGPETEAAAEEGEVKK